jgi:hypothetical protein
MLTSINSKDSSELRNKMFSCGFESLKLENHHIDKIIWIDNTLNSIEQVHNSILESLPPNTEIILNKELNQYGCKNKGAGIIECIRHLGHQILNYDFYIHHEPRTIVKDQKQFNKFFTNNLTTFATTNLKTQFWTGTFKANSKDLFKYVNQINLNEMCKKFISIEDDLKKYYDMMKINYLKLEKAGVIWHDYKKGIYFDA